MKLNNNKGFTLIDASISLLLLLIFIPTLGGIIYSIEKTDNSIKRKVTAINFATDILETAKSVDYDKAVLTNSQEDSNEFIDKIIQKYQLQNIDISYKNYDTEVEFITKDSKDTIYKINIKLVNYTDTEEFLNKYPLEEDPKDVVKKIIAKVEYPIGNRTEYIDISSILKKY